LAQKVSIGMFRERPAVKGGLHMGPRKQAWMAAAAGAAAVLVTATAAYAHFYGTMAVGGDLGGTSITVGLGRGPLGFAYRNPCSIEGGAKASASGGSVTVALGPNTGGGDCPASVLQSGTDDVRFFNGTAFNIATDGTYTRDLDHFCLHNVYGESQGVIKIGELRVMGGSGSGGPFRLPDHLKANTTTRDASAVCVTSQVNSEDTSAAPIIIVKT